MVSYHWSTHQLTEYFAAVSGPLDEDGAVLVAAERVAETLDAEVGAVVIGGEVRGSTGFGGEGPPAALAAVTSATETLEIPGAGTLQAAVGAVGRPADGYLVVARVDEPFSTEERQLLDGMAQGLGLALRSLRTLAAERRLREEREREAEQRLELLNALEARQRLLETLLAIQRAISNRKPLQEVLDAVTAGASGLLDGSGVALVLAAPYDAGQLIVASTCGRQGRAGDDATVLAAAADAMASDQVVTRVAAGRKAAGRTSAAPVRVDGETTGSLVATTRGGADQREFLAAFAQQVSLALTDARTVEAMREAYHDSITGLPNRALFVDRLKHALAVADRRRDDVTVLFIDLDRFKAVNDSLGHAAGDELLAAVADRIRRCLRAADTAARLGGDEFAVLLEGTPGEGGVEVAERIIRAAKEPFRVGGRDVFIAASVGVAPSRPPHAEASTLLGEADVAMYQAKKHHPGRAVIFEPRMHAEALEHLDLQADLQRALGLDEFRLQYQPLVRLDTRTPVATEALLRWTNPRRGSVPPSLFIPVAEETGMIVDLGRWVLREAAGQTAEWRRQVPGLTLNVNVSAREVADPRYLTTLAEILAGAGLPAAALTLELTETTLMSDPDDGLAHLDRLRGLGVRLAVDDFGTGYSSLSYLRRFPVNQVKIDRGFIAGVAQRADDFAVARAVIDLGRTLRLQTVAEGIEDAAQLDALRQLGCDLGQGYYLSRPLDPEAVPAYLAEHGVVAAAL
ncbi:MAG TPA: EAL domain-containing protein [Actinomycetes bacterium]